MVWVVPLSRHTLTTCRRFPVSTATEHSEFDGRPRDCSPKIPHQYLYHSDYLDEDLTTANFGRNQLSPVSIGFSPLHTGYKNTCS